MVSYDYEARRTDGTLVRGGMDAANLNSLKDALSRQGLFLETAKARSASGLTLKARKGRPLRIKSGGKDDIKVQLPTIPLAPGTARTTCTSILLPNVTVTVTQIHLASVIIDPIAPDRTIEKLGFFVGDGAKSHKYTSARKQVLDRWLGKNRPPTGRDGISSQDFSIWKEQQTARHSPVANKVVFSPVWERNVHHFQQKLLETMQG